MKLLCLAAVLFPSIALSAVDCDAIATRNLKAIGYQDNAKNHESMVNICKLGERYAKSGITQKDFGDALKSFDATHDRAELRKKNVLIEGYHGGLRDLGKNAFDLEKNEFVSDDEVRLKSNKISSCTNLASKLVRDEINEGYLPLSDDPSFNANLQMSRQNEYINRCLNQQNN
ncbi:hypothetical protein [Lelliottia amnigena]|uniref:hypothetical protein n=1 Tax=Lelliottia amnigena TaxID=61646 RepID=UPI001C5C98EC|nr:hypothetical protein [Lelliottia amnigena]QXZ19067.1 hypothetical protein I6L75_18495 [Lelliottia amnigena]